MEFYIQDPNIHSISPEYVRILDLRAEPHPVNHRVRIVLERTPFQQRPSIELSLMNDLWELVESTSIVDPITCWDYLVLDET